MDRLNIVFFDGYCHICDTFVSSLYVMDFKSKLKFSPLSGKTAEMYDLSVETQTVVFFKNKSERFTKSDAILEILMTIFPLLSFVFKLFKLIPNSLRDGLYDFIARNRYRIFKKKEFCRLVTEQEREAFLD